MIKQLLEDIKEIKKINHDELTQEDKDLLEKEGVKGIIKLISKESKEATLHLKKVIENLKDEINKDIIFIE